MDLVTLDFETAYGTKYTLKGMTYEEYIFDPRFKVFGVGIKINNGVTQWYNETTMTEALTSIFDPIQSSSTTSSSTTPKQEKVITKKNPSLETEHGTTEPTTKSNEQLTTSSTNVCLLAHNNLFDGAILAWHFGLKAQMYLCTQAMSRAIWNHQSSSLATLTKTCFPSDKTKRKGKEIVQFKDIWELTPSLEQTLSKYCINDVDITYADFMVMNKYFPNDELRLLDMTLQMFIHPPFMADIPRVTAYKHKLEEEKKLALINSGLPKTTLSSNNKFANWMIDQGIPFSKIPSPTEKNPDNMKWPLSKTDREFTEIRARHPEFAHVWEGRLQAKSPGELRRAERIERHAILHGGHIAVPLNYCAAHTFRHGGTNKVNFQNFKRGSEIRYSLMAPEGELVVVQDLSNIESRMLAWLAKEEGLLSDYRNKVDTYNVFASRLFQRPIDRKRTVIGDNGETSYPDATEGFVGKTCILGLGFQVAEKKLQNQLFGSGLVFTLPECKGFKDMYRGTYPAIPRLWRTAQQMIYHMTRKDEAPVQWGPMRVEFRRILMPNGLYMDYPGLRPVFENASLVGYEYWNGKHWTNLYGGKLTENVVQSLSRILMTTAMLKVHGNLVRNKIGRVALTVHDEIIATVTAKHAEEVNTMMAETLCDNPDWCNDGTLTLASEGGFAENYSK